MKKCQFHEARILFLIISLGLCKITTAQLVTPSVLNISGSTVNTGNYSFDWSVGESTAISTLTNGNLMITQGVLQYQSAKIVERNIGIVWFPNEVKLFPNPVTDFFEVNFKHLVPGTIHLELFTNAGQLLWQNNFLYNGIFHIEKISMLGLVGGQYTLYIYQEQIPGRVGVYYKRGAFKILKIN